MNFKSSNFKIYLGSVYVAVLLAVIYFLFSNFDISDLTSYEFIRENKGLILKYKESNIFFSNNYFFYYYCFIKLVIMSHAPAYFGDWLYFWQVVRNSNPSLWEYTWWCFVVSFS